MDRRGSSTVNARNGLALVGLAICSFGLIQGGVGVAQYERPNLGTGVRITNAAAVKDSAFHDMAVGAVAIAVGAVIGLAGIARSRRDRRNASHTVTTVPLGAEKTIDLTRTEGLEPMPNGAANGLAPIAQRVWDCRLAVDLQQQRLMKEGVGAESRIDAELYVLALRNLVGAVKAAQAATRSLVTWEALTTFARTGGDPDEFLAEIARAGSADDGTTGRVGVRFPESGTEIVIGAHAVKAETLSAAADLLANATVGDLTDIRSRAASKQTRRTPVH
jgi:hypothetical protein